MNDLMNELENLILIDVNNEINCNDEENQEEEITDWDVLTRMKRGVDRTNNSVIKMLETLNLDSKVRVSALDFFYRTIKYPEFKKIKFKSAIMCASIYLAFTVHNDPREEKSLLKHFSISQSKYTKGLRFVKTYVSEVRNVQYTSDNVIFYLCSEMNIIENIQDIKDFINIHMKSSVKNSMKFSNKMTINALFYIWLFLNKSTIPSVISFAKLCGISPTSIKKVIYKNNILIMPFVEASIKDKMEPFITEIQTLKINKKKSLDKIINKINYREMAKNVIKQEFLY